MINASNGRFSHGTYIRKITNLSVQNIFKNNNGTIIIFRVILSFSSVANLCIWAAAEREEVRYCVLSHSYWQRIVKSLQFSFLRTRITHIINIFHVWTEARKTLHQSKLYIWKICFTGFNDWPKMYKLHGQAYLDEQECLCCHKKPILTVMWGNGQFRGMAEDNVTSLPHLRRLRVVWKNLKILGMNTKALHRHYPMYRKSSWSNSVFLRIPSYSTVWRTRMKSPKHFCSWPMTLT